MGTKAIGADSASMLAGLQIDQLQKYRRGQMTLDHLKWFNMLTRAQRDMLSRAGLSALGQKPKPKRKESARNLRDLFKTRKGLWVSPRFQERILAPALEKLDVAPATVREPYDLLRDMTDGEILEKLGLGHVFGDEKAFCFHLANALERQWNGKKGDLLNNAYANIFYVRGVNEREESDVLAVDVRWLADDGRWGVFAYRLGGRTWGQGSRAFPSN